MIHPQRASIVSAIFCPPARVETDRRWEQGEDPSLVDFHASKAMNQVLHPKIPGIEFTDREGDPGQAARRGSLRRRARSSVRKRERESFPAWVSVADVVAFPLERLGD